MCWRVSFLDEQLIQTTFYTVGLCKILIKNKLYVYIHAHTSIYFQNLYDAAVSCPSCTLTCHGKDSHQQADPPVSQQSGFSLICLAASLKPLGLH